MFNKYEVVEEIGRGSYGSVHLCRDGDTGLVSGVGLCRGCYRG